MPPQRRERRHSAGPALAVKLNPECEHIVGDMRSMQLDRTFDVVFIHDAIAYMTNESDRVWLLWSGRQCASARSRSRSRSRFLARSGAGAGTGAAPKEPHPNKIR